MMLFNLSKWWLAALFLLIVTPIALSGFLPNGLWGISDWDYYFSYHEVVRSMTLGYGEVPQWNPYICGGTSTIGDPEFPLFTPTFLLELAFGIPFGLRLAILATTAMTAIGMLFLSKKLGLSFWASLVAAIAGAFGSVTLLEVVEGHPNVFAASYVPWVLLLWLAAYRKNKFSWRELVLAVLLALMFFQGGIYLLMYLAFAFLFLIVFSRNRIKALKVTALSGVIAIGLAATKLLPVFFWLQEFQDQAYASSAYTLPYLKEIFLGRHLHGTLSENVIPNQGGGWHEYGAYLGPFVITLAAASLALLKKSRIARLLWLAAIIATLVSATGPILKPLFDLAPWLPRSNVSRVILFAVIPLSLLAGMGLDYLLKITSKFIPTGRVKPSLSVNLIGALIVIIAALNIMTLSNQLSKQAFVLEPASTKQAASYPLEHTIDTDSVRVDGVDYTRAYANIIAGVGTQSYCSVLSPEAAIKTRQHKDEDASFVTLIPPEAGTVELLEWSPRSAQVMAKLNAPATVTLNTNFATGWSFNEKLADDNSGRVSARLPAGDHDLEFVYRAKGYKAGLTISGLTVMAILLLAWRRRSA